MSALTSRTRRGFTLAELIVAMLLFAVVGGAIYQVLATNQRTFDAQAQAMDLAQNLRDAAALLPNELRELDAADGDIIAMTDSSITMRSMRQLGIMCSVPVLGGALTARTFLVRPLRSAVTPFAVNDSLLFFYEGNQALRSDDAWVLGKVTAISGAAALCPGDANNAANTTAISMTADLKAFTAPQVNAVGNISVGSPVRGFQLITYKRYLASDGKYYLAVMPNNTGTPQPIIGPLAGAAGLVLSYYDAAGAATAVPTSVAQIRIFLKAQTPKDVMQRNGVAAPSSDAVALAVTLRNNPRF